MQEAQLDQALLWDQRHSLEVGALTEPSEFARKALPFIREVRGSSVLELGCGKGGDAVFFSSKGLMVTAVDFSKTALASLRQSIEGTPHAQKIALVEQRMKSLDLQSEYFDCVYSHNSLHHLHRDDLVEVLKKAHKSLKTGGIIAFRVKSNEDPLKDHARRLEGVHEFEGLHWNFLSKDALEDLLYDFTILSLEKKVDLRKGSKAEVAWEVLAQKP